LGVAGYAWRFFAICCRRSSQMRPVSSHLCYAFCQASISYDPNTFESSRDSSKSSVVASWYCSRSAPLFRGHHRFIVTPKQKPTVFRRAVRSRSHSPSGSCWTGSPECSDQVLLGRSNLGQKNPTSPATTVLAFTWMRPEKLGTFTRSFNPAVASFDNTRERLHERVAICSRLSA